MQDFDEHSFNFYSRFNTFSNNNQLSSNVRLYLSNGACKKIANIAINKPDIVVGIIP